MPHVAIFGVGSIGGIIAGSLLSARKCQSVSLIARGRAYQALSNTGLKLKTFEGQKYHFDHKQYHLYNSDTDNKTSHPLDYILVCTKAHQLPAIAEKINALISPKTIVIPCTNGLPFWFHTGLKSTDPNGILTKAMPMNHLLGSVGMISGSVKSDYSQWETNWPAERNTLLLGRPNVNDNNDAVNNNGRAQQLADLFQGSQVHVKVDVCQSTDPQQIRDRIFDKLLINCAINSIGALGRVNCGETCEPNSSSEKLLRKLVNEATAVACNLNPPIKLSLDADQILKHYNGQYELKSSMLHDVEKSQQTEKSAIIDSLVELGTIYNINTPHLETISLLLDTVERSFFSK